MPEIRVVEPHALPPAEARQRLGGFADVLARYRIRLEWDGDRARLAGVPGVGGEVVVRPAEVAVLVTLSRLVLLTGLDPARLEASIRRRLHEALSTP